jgi:hypothetical protein
MNYSAIRFIAISAALITLALMIYMARPWGDNYAYQSMSGYILLLGFAVWATIPYLMVLSLARRAFASQANKLPVVIVALIISFGGVALYVDAALWHPDPQGALVLISSSLLSMDYFRAVNDSSSFSQQKASSMTTTPISLGLSGPLIIANDVEI